MGKKGYFQGIVVLFAAVMLLGIGFILRPLLGSRGLLNNHVKGVQARYDGIAAMERVLAVLEKNISYEGNVYYEDIEKNFEVKSVSAEVLPVRIVESGESYIEKRFGVYSATDIVIEIEMLSGSGGYYVTLYNAEGDLVFSEYCIADKRWVVTSEEVYDEFGRTYGEYMVAVLMDRAFVEVAIDYEITEERLVLVEGDVTRHWKVTNGFDQKNILEPV